MKNRLLISLIFLFKSFIALSNTNNYTGAKSVLPIPVTPSGTIVFDMTNAVMAGNYIDIPIYFTANIKIQSIGFALTFNVGNLTYDSIVNLNPDLDGTANQLPDKSLSFEASAHVDSENPTPTLENGKPMLYIRFHFTSPGNCVLIKSTDFNPTYVHLDEMDNTSLHNCSYLITAPIAYRVPNANFSNNKPCKGITVTFIDSSEVLKDSITSWKWNFGNGSTSTTKNPSTTYTSNATYTVTLIATSNLGCSDTVSKSFHVNPAPTANFTSAADCPSGNFMFTDLSYITSPGKITDWAWDFGDHKPPLLHQQYPNYDYDYGGSYTVTLTAISDSGCTSNYSSKVAVTMLSAIFGAKDGCKGLPIAFLDSSITAASAGAITDWKWYFGDGTTGSTTASSKDISYAYKDTGTYTVGLKVSNSKCSDSIAHTITIQDKPVVKFIEDKISGCMPLTINFSDTSVTSSGSVYSWNFGDSDTTSSSKNASHIYVNNGNYTVTHYVVTSAGCSDSLVKTAYINVYGALVSFTPSAQKVKLPDAAVSFTNSTKNYTSWMWNFGDSTFVTSYSAQHTFADTGSYLVCLTGKDSKGCSSYHCDSITVIPANVVAIPEAFTPNNDNINDVLKIRGGPITEVEWRIFDEWGVQVFQTNTQGAGWEGTFNGTPQPAGTYQYSLKGKTVFDNETVNIHGIVNLVR